MGVAVGMGVSVGGAEVTTVKFGGGRVPGVESALTDGRQEDKPKKRIRPATGNWNRNCECAGIGPILIPNHLSFLFVLYSTVIQ